LIRLLCARAKIGAKTKVRVGGGIRTAARAARILSWGAEKIIVGSAAFKNAKVNRNFLVELRKRVGKNKVVIALDTERGNVVIRGWRERLKLRPVEVIPALEPYCSGFLSTLVDNEGAMRGTNLKWFRELQRITKLPITAAGGITTMREVAALEKAGMDSAIGMAIYTGKLAANRTGFAASPSKKK
jgi:phosphoribosylformimino-5-aminoimidazole carboxamide ribonucleotide (ProFAR) isomerase